MRHQAIYELYDNVVRIDDNGGSFDQNGIPVNIDETLVNAKIEELSSIKSLELLRIERNRLLNETDWEVQRNTEMGIDNTDLIAYRIALRNLPQEIEAGNIEPPTMDENGNLVFNHWPER